jgi:probable F420-dependent oxidoreductase
VDGLRFDIEIPTCREGVFVPCGFAGPDDVIECVKLAERLGYEAVWATDFLTPTSESGVRATERPDWYEPMITLAYAAAETSRVRLGTGIIVLPYRDPVILAKQAATLDRLSKGRFLLGLGLGAWRTEFKAVAAWRKRAHRGNMAAEFTEVLRRLLAHDDGSVTFDGEYVSIRDVALGPKPVQNPLPFYMVGRNDDALDRVARFGNALMAPHGAAAERKRALAERADTYGRTIGEFDVLAEGELLLAETHEAAAAAYRESRFGQYRALRGLDLDRQIAANWVGTPESVASMIGAVVEQGIDHFNVLHIVGDSLEARFEQMQMFMEDVVPRLG